MNALLLLDREAKTDFSQDLRARLLAALQRKGHRTEDIELGREDALACVGCLRCLTEHPGVCVHKDTVGEIIKRANTYDLTIFVTPVVFGHFSSTITNAMCRGTGNHHWQVVVGYGSAVDVDEEERSTFVDLVAKHRGAADVVHPGMDRQVDVFVTRSSEDSNAICLALESSL